MIWIALLVLAALAIVLAVGFNRLVRLRNECDQGAASIDVQLKRRADLIPNLVEAVKAYAAHERTVLEAVTQARASTLQASTLGSRAEADGHTQAALASLFAVAEGYPQLQASEGFRRLQEELSETEDRIAAARRYYNSVVRRYATARQSLPTNVIARAFAFAPRDYYRLEDDADREPVRVTT